MNENELRYLLATLRDDETNQGEAADLIEALIARLADAGALIEALLARIPDSERADFVAGWKTLRSAEHAESED